MPTTLIIGIGLLAICILYGWASSLYRKQDTIIGVSAGGEDSDIISPSYSASSRSVKLLNGKYINTRNYIRIKINGKCMTPRNILDGEEWLVEPLNNIEDKKSILKVKDVILLYIEDKGRYILREFEDYDIDGSLKTLRYNDDKTERHSSRNHQLNQVKGIVRYAI